MKPLKLHVKTTLITSTITISVLFASLLSNSIRIITLAHQDQKDLARLQAIAPAMRRAALSATVAEPDLYRRWLAPAGGSARLVLGDPGAPPELDILLPEDRVPWAGHSGAYAVPQVMAVLPRLMRK